MTAYVFRAISHVFSNEERKKIKTRQNWDNAITSQETLFGKKLHNANVVPSDSETWNCDRDFGESSFLSTGMPTVHSTAKIDSLIGVYQHFQHI